MLYSLKMIKNKEDFDCKKLLIFQPYSWKHGHESRAYLEKIFNTFSTVWCCRHCPNFLTGSRFFASGGWFWASGSKFEAFGSCFWASKSRFYTFENRFLAVGSRFRALEFDFVCDLILGLWESILGLWEPIFGLLEPILGHLEGFWASGGQFWAFELWG